MTDLEDVQEELAQARDALVEKETAPLHVIVDEDRYQLSLMQLQKRVRALEDEERRLLEEEGE